MSMLQAGIFSSPRLHWSSQYVGLPFAEGGRSRKGVDCWGLLHLIFRDQYGIEVPSYAEQYVGKEERREIARLLETETKTDPWISVIPGSEQEGDMATFRDRRAGLPSHTGMVLSKSRMLHVSRGRLASIECYRTPVWDARLIGFYRHETLA